MSYESISLVEMDDFLRQRRFKPVDLYFRRRPVKEWVYERRLPQNANHFVRVYTTIQRYGGKTDQSRDVGKDAIRVQVIYRDEKGETLVSMPKRVNRISTWRDNLDDRLKEVAESLPKVKMDSRGEPMTLRKKRGNLFWGSRDYPAFKETRRYGSEQAETVRECCQCGKTEGITTIQAGTYCYECLPINLGAEEYLNPNDPEMINILLLEWAMKTNERYDSLTIQKGLANYIDVSPYDFVRHMQDQDLISLNPAVNLGWNALVPADFLYYLQDKERDHWVNMKARAVGIERYKYLKEKISEERYWLSDSKKDYHRWSFQSAINYQNI